jgi:hypothetical protein
MVATTSAITTATMPAPNTAATASPIRIAGKASSTSTSRMIQPSSRR